MRERPTPAPKTRAIHGHDISREAGYSNTICRRNEAAAISGVVEVGATGFIIPAGQPIPDLSSCPEPDFSNIESAIKTLASNQRRIIEALVNIGVSL